MIVEYSKSFQKAINRLSEKTLVSITKVIIEVKNAGNVSDLSNCKKIVGYNIVYRIRIGDHRAFFTFHICIQGNTAKFEYLISRGQAYNKNILSILQKKDI
jgi:mRNA-degrading endonuclease RelE of RelBE toxin-antitoxin system